MQPDKRYTRKKFQVEKVSSLKPGFSSFFPFLFFCGCWLYAFLFYSFLLQEPSSKDAAEERGVLKGTNLTSRV